MRNTASTTIEFLALRDLPLATEPLRNESPSNCHLVPSGEDYSRQDIAACTDQDFWVLWITAGPLQTECRWR